MRYVRAIYFGGHVLRILQAHVISTRFMIDLRRERELPELITSLMRQISVVNIGGCGVLASYSVSFPWSTRLGRLKTIDIEISDWSLFVDYGSEASDMWK